MKRRVINPIIAALMLLAAVSCSPMGPKMKPQSAIIIPGVTQSDNQTFVEELRIISMIPNPRLMIATGGDGKASWSVWAKGESGKEYELIATNFRLISPNVPNMLTVMLPSSMERIVKIGVKDRCNSYVYNQAGQKGEINNEIKGGNFLETGGATASMVGDPTYEAIKNIYRTEIFPLQEEVKRIYDGHRKTYGENFYSTMSKEDFVKMSKQHPRLENFLTKGWGAMATYPLSSPADIGFRLFLSKLFQIEDFFNSDVDGCMGNTRLTSEMVARNVATGITLYGGGNKTTDSRLNLDVLRVFVKGTIYEKCAETEGTTMFLFNACQQRAYNEELEKTKKYNEEVEKHNASILAGKK
jgi:hypothetical protein